MSSAVGTADAALVVVVLLLLLLLVDDDPPKLEKLPILITEKSTINHYKHKMGRRADGGGTALYLKRIHSPFLILVYQRIGSVAAPNSTKKNGRNPYRLSR